jgi:hypothetical protein
MKKFSIGILVMIILASFLSSCNNALPERKEFPTSESSEETSDPAGVQTEALVSDMDSTETSGVTSAVEETTEIIIREVDFNQYLDDIHFVPRMSQRDFIDMMGTYKCNGENVNSDYGTFYDGEYGGGYFVNGKGFRFCNDYTVTEDKKYSVYTNELTTDVQLEGLDLPNSINFDYKLSMVLLSLDLDVDLERDFADAEDAKVILRSDETSSLTLTRYSLSDEDSEYSYQLTYEENYPITYTSGKGATVTRYVKMRFTKDDDALGSLSIAVIEMAARD